MTGHNVAGSQLRGDDGREGTFQTIAVVLVPANVDVACGSCYLLPAGAGAGAGAGALCLFAT